MNAARDAWEVLSSGMDWPAALILAGVVLLEGFRRVPAGALVLRAGLGDRWLPVVLDPGIRLVSWFAPLTRTLILTTSPATSGPELSAIRQRLNAVRAVSRVLQALGALALFGLILGLPWATARFGAWGFLTAVGALFFLSLSIALLTAIGLCRVGSSRATALRDAIPLLSPFASGRGPEILLRGISRGAPPLAVARALMQPEDFDPWVRPRVFDADAEEGADAELDRVVSSAERGRLLGAAPDPGFGGATFCPRCGQAFVWESGECPDCGVRLALRSSEALGER